MFIEIVDNGIGCVDLIGNFENWYSLCVYTTRIPSFFLLNFFVKKDPFWTSHFEPIHCDLAMYFFTKPKLAFSTSTFD
jgi:hypothetical protein